MFRAEPVRLGRGLRRQKFVAVPVVSAKFTLVHRRHARLVDVLAPINVNLPDITVDIRIIVLLFDGAGTLKQLLLVALVTEFLQLLQINAVTNQCRLVELLLLGVAHR